MIPQNLIQHHLIKMKSKQMGTNQKRRAKRKSHSNRIIRLKSYMKLILTVILKQFITMYLVIIPGSHVTMDANVFQMEIFAKNFANVQMNVLIVLEVVSVGQTAAVTIALASQLCENAIRIYANLVEPIISNLSNLHLVNAFLNFLRFLECLKILKHKVLV